MFLLNFWTKIKFLKNPNAAEIQKAAKVFEYGIRNTPASIYKTAGRARVPYVFSGFSKIGMVLVLTSENYRRSLTRFAFLHGICNRQRQSFTHK
jgi:hypothetical protein